MFFEGWRSFSLLSATVQLKEVDKDSYIVWRKGEAFILSWNRGKTRLLSHGGKVFPELPLLTHKLKLDLASYKLRVGRPRKIGTAPCPITVEAVFYLPARVPTVAYLTHGNLLLIYSGVYRVTSGFWKPEGLYFTLNRDLPEDVSRTLLHSLTIHEQNKKRAALPDSSRT
jgi:hypothetical protein